MGIVKASDPRPPDAFRWKAPERANERKWLEHEMQRYIAAVEYLSYFIECRAKMGDIGSPELFEELKANVCMHMRDGCDQNGVN